MSNEKNNTPLIIIGAVVVIAVIGGWWLYSSGNSPKKPVANSNSVAKSNAGEAFKTAPAGAEPAWSKGAANATVTIEEFVDFACPQCAKATPVVQQARAAYGDRVRVVFRHFPLDIPAHKNAYDASRAAEAAGIQGKFWEMENLLFKNQSAWSPASLNPRPIFEEYAKQIGLDTVKFNDDLIGMMTTSRVDKDKVRGRALNVSSTPSVYLNNRLLNIEDITPDNLKKLIDAELAKSQTPAANSATNTNTNTPTN